MLWDNLVIITDTTQWHAKILDRLLVVDAIRHFNRRLTHFRLLLALGLWPFEKSEKILLLSNVMSFCIIPTSTDCWGKRTTSSVEANLCTKLSAALNGSLSFIFLSLWFSGDLSCQQHARIIFYYWGKANFSSNSNGPRTQKIPQFAILANVFQEVHKPLRY